MNFLLIIPSLLISQVFAANVIDPFDAVACNPDTRPRVLTGEFGVFSSPNHPNNYPANSHCEWRISLNDENAQVVVAFLNFTLEECTDCACDYVTAYDGDSTDAPIIGTICGGHTQNPGPFTASSDEMYIVFRSDADTEFDGFAAIYGGSDDPCVGGPNAPRIIQDIAGEITSPNHPGNYPNSILCAWRIEALPDAFIALELGPLDIENCCDCDYVAVHDGPTMDSTRFGRFYSNEYPPTITSTGDSLYIMFRTDGSIVGQGFNASFIQLPAV